MAPMNLFAKQKETEGENKLADTKQGTEGRDELRDWE